MKKVSSRTSASAGPRKVGGTGRDAAGVNWLKVGRGRTDSRNAVTDLGATMKAVREQSNMSVSQLAKKLNVAPATLIKFEDRGHPVSVLIVQRMANALGYDVTLKKRSGT